MWNKKLITDFCKILEFTIKKIDKLENTSYKKNVRDSIFLLKTNYSYLVKIELFSDNKKNLKINEAFEHTYSKVLEISQEIVFLKNSLNLKYKSSDKKIILFLKKIILSSKIKEYITTVLTYFDWLIQTSKNETAKELVKDYEFGKISLSELFEEIFSIFEKNKYYSKKLFNEYLLLIFLKVFKKTKTNLFKNKLLNLFQMKIFNTSFQKEMVIFSKVSHNTYLEDYFEFISKDKYVKNLKDFLNKKMYIKEPNNLINSKMQYFTLFFQREKFINMLIQKDLQNLSKIKNNNFPFGCTLYESFLNYSRSFLNKTVELQNYNCIKYKHKYEIFSIENNKNFYSYILYN